MAAPAPEVMDRKLAALDQFIADLGAYAELDRAGLHREHYAVERLLQLLCEAAADLGLQLLKARGQVLPGSYREVFSALAQGDGLPQDLREGLIAACGLRNVLTHLYDTIDLDRVIDAVGPALGLYRAYRDWIVTRLASAPGAPPG